MLLNRLRKLHTTFIGVAATGLLMTAYYLNVTARVSIAMVPDTNEFADDTFGPVQFDIDGSDVMVFLHIQKTGGSSFGRHLVSDLILEKECDILENRKRRNCMRPNSETETWLVSEYSTGWICGVHSGWTELNECVDKKLNGHKRTVHRRKYFYVTILRNPIDRYVSEYCHVVRGATWRTTKYSCNHRGYDIPWCYKGLDWRGVSLQEFMSCPHNMAANRQTRMLADLRLVQCYDRWVNDSLTPKQVLKMERGILKSAKENLKRMSYFGVTEEQLKLQALFEFTFPLRFKKNFIQYNSTRATDFNVSDKDIVEIKRLNYLDIELYKYAKRLFNFRFRKLISKESAIAN